MSMILYQILLQYRIWIGGMYLTWFEYMTSDVPFKEKENEYLFSGTIGEAMEQGITLPDWCKKYELHRKILLSLDGEAEAGFFIKPFESINIICFLICRNPFKPFPRIIYLI